MEADLFLLIERKGTNASGSEAGCVFPMASAYGSAPSRVSTPQVHAYLIFLLARQQIKKTDLAVRAQEMVFTLSRVQNEQQEEPHLTQLNHRLQFALLQESPGLQDSTATH